MKTRIINGILFEKMLRNGLNNIRLHEEELNSLNVYPVADGDTGTNMRLTLENGLSKSKRSKHTGVFLMSLSNGMLLGARGNSGVILSQLFRGMAVALMKDIATNPGRIRNALIRGYRQAYESVIHPVEGTILTVAREGVENIRNQVNRDITLEVFFSLYIAEMRRSLERTPQLLTELKDAGVVDSGALGYIYLIEGMQKYLYGEVIASERRKTRRRTEEQGPEEYIDDSLFNETSLFEDGYCMEFLLQLMKGNGYSQFFKLNEYIADLKNYGSSLVVVQEGSRVKVHVHTLKPAKIIMLSQEYGEFVTFKLENMQLQHNHRDETVVKLQDKKHEHKPLFKIAAVNGDGFERLFEQFGCDVVLTSQASLNTSSREFLEAIKSADADKIVILPNNSNSFGAAEQAVSLSGLENVTILPAGNMVEGYYAIAMDVADSDDLDFRIQEMKSGSECVTTLAVANATKDYSSEKISFIQGDVVVLYGGEPVASAHELVSAVKKALSSIDMEWECCTIFRGMGLTEEKCDELVQLLENSYPGKEVSVLEGGQEIYHCLLGLV